MKNIRIEYFTGTGSSEWIARLLADKLTNDHTHIEVNRIYRDNIIGVKKLEADYYILIFPVYAFAAPKSIYDWVKHLDGNQCKAAVISVSGGGDVLSNSACRRKTVKLMKKSNFDVIFEDMVRMPNNWVKVPDKEKCVRILSDLPNKIAQIAQAVLSETKGKKAIYWIDYLISALGETMKRFTHKFGKGVEVLERCVGCGLCAKNCCTSNIQLSPKPKFGGRCDMCLGCVYNCPQKALRPTYGAFQVDKNGYNFKSYAIDAGTR